MHLMLCLSTLSIHTLVFVALTQHLMQVWNICIKWPLAPAKREGYCIVWAFHLGGLAVHQSVRGGSFVNFLGLVKLQGWLQARRTANSQFLKLKGAQQPSNSCISMGTKLHLPHSNKLPACTEFWSKKVSSVLEDRGPVQFLWSWQVQFYAKFTHMSKQMCQFTGFSIKCWGARWPKLAWV